MSRAKGSGVRTLWRVTSTQQEATLPDFVTPIDSGMNAAGDASVIEVAGSRLSDDVARQLSQQLRDIADARLAARAASRDAFIR